MGNYVDTSGLASSYGARLTDSLTSSYGMTLSGSMDAAVDSGIDVDVLRNVFAGDATDAANLEDMLAKITQENFKELDQHSEKEKGEKGGIHVFGQFKAAMKTAFPGWPHDTTLAEQVADAIASVPHAKSAAPIFQAHPDVKSAYDRFVNSLYPGKAGKITDAKAFGILKILAGGVKYCTTELAEQKYKVELGASMTRRGRVFDSQDLYKDKTARYLQGSIAGGGGNDFTKFRSIWVMSWSQANEPEFFTHIGKIGRFHHSSFKAGEAIMAAGEWVIEAGACRMINSCSGHYRPEPWRFLAACIQLKNRAVITPQTVVEVWETRSGDRKLVPCLPFVARFETMLNDYRLYP